jgi:hypothetical protein
MTFRYIKSGSGRSLGPNDDERSGIDFVIRTIGRHGGKKPVEPSEAKAEADASMSEADGDLFVGSMGSVGSDEVMTSSDLAADPLTMTASQLRQVAGDVAEDLANAYFQHTARMTLPALFRPLSSMLTITTEKGSKLYRKGQVDPSVCIRAFSSALNTSSLALVSSDVFVNVTGGTPEPIVAAIQLGFKTIFHVVESTEEELLWQLPTPEAEKVQDIDYFKYHSPCPEVPLMGLLAAEAVRQLSEYLKNDALNVLGALRLSLPDPRHEPNNQAHTSCGTKYALGEFRGLEGQRRRRRGQG